MTALDLDAIEKRAEAATEGPWEADKPNAYGSYWGQVEVRSKRPGLDDPRETFIAGAYELSDEEVTPKLLANLNFIAAAREDVPALVAEVRRLRAVLREVEYVDQDTIYGTRGLCPVCERMRPGSTTWQDETLDAYETGHALGCRLKAALGEP